MSLPGAEEQCSEVSVGLTWFTRSPRSQNTAQPEKAHITKATASDSHLCCSLPLCERPDGSLTCCEILYTLKCSRFSFCSVVKFRRTGESARSEDDGGSREQDVRIGAEQTNLESVALADGAPVPREFANPTDGTVLQAHSSPGNVFAPLSKLRLLVVFYPWYKSVSQIISYTWIFTFLIPTDTFMVEDAVEAIGFGTFQWKLSILTGLSWVRTTF